MCLCFKKNNLTNGKTIRNGQNLQQRIFSFIYINVCICTYMHIYQCLPSVLLGCLFLLLLFWPFHILLSISEATSVSFLLLITSHRWSVSGPAAAGVFLCGVCPHSLSSQSGFSPISQLRLLFQLYVLVIGASSVHLSFPLSLCPSSFHMPSGSLLFHEALPDLPH